MRSYFDKSLIAAGFAATVAVVSMGWLACAGPGPVDKTADKDDLTAEQCIDNHAVKGSVEPYEDALVAEGIVDTDLDKISITQGMCEEIIERTPGGSPIARAVAVGNLTQELDVIKKSMQDAAEKDVNGDGRVDAEDTKVAVAASYAASHAAQETVRRAAEEGSTGGGAIEEINAEPAAHLAQQQATASATSTTPAEQTTPAGATTPAEQTTPAGTTTPAGATTPAEQTTPVEPTTSAASAKASAKGGAAGGRARSAELSLREKAQIKASRAAEGQGAGQEAAGSASQCAATVAFTNETLKVVRGHMRFKAPAKEMHWKDRDEVQLAVAPKTWVPIEELKQEVDQAQGAGVECIKLGDKMEAYFIPDDHFDITPHDAREQDVELEKSTTWTWDIVASEKGEHLLDLNVTAHVYSPSERDMYRSIQQDPPLFDDYINVSATTPEVFTAFVADRWPVLVPLLLTILTAIIIPFVVPWWKRRNQPSEPVDRSSAYRDDGWM